MQPILYNVVVILHILLVAVWLASGLGLGGRLKRAHAKGGLALAAAVDEAARARVLALVGSLGTLFSGVGLIFVQYQGFKGLPVGFHLALGLVLLGLIVEFALVGPAVKAVREGPAGLAAAKRVAAGTGVIHLIWMVSLAFMIIKKL